jgi:hypothetical protein
VAKWFVQANGEQVGPMTVGELRLLAATGRLHPTDRVRKDTISRWTRAKSVRGLFAAVPEEVAVMAGDGDDQAGVETVSPLSNGSGYQVTAASPPAGSVPLPGNGPPAGTEEMLVLPVMPAAPGRLVIVEVSGRAVDFRPDGTAAVHDGYTTLQLVPGWLVAVSALANGPGRETYLRLARLDAAVFSNWLAPAGSPKSEYRVLSFHVGRQSAAVAVEGNDRPFRNFLDAVIAAGGGGRKIVPAND